MALKDWKKEKHEDFIEYINGDAGIKIVDFESGDGKQKGFKVYIREKNSKLGSAYSKEFKTKSQALNYAQKYMRSH